MKLLQVNIWMGKLQREVVKLIEAEQPDIICMQEVFSSNGAVVHVPDESFSSLEVIQKATGFESFFASTLGMPYGNIKLEFGNAILSRFPLSDQKTIFTAGDYLSELDVTQHFPNNRNVQIARIETAGKSLWVANHHGYWQPNAVGNEDTVRSHQRVADELRELSGPRILAGDLNVSFTSPAMRVFDDFLEDLTATHNIATTLSQFGKVSTVPCDHVLVSSDIRVTNFSVSEALVSDHKALVLEFEL